jgi:hypothetical protein
MSVTPQTPPTTTPVLERITANIIETLQTITVQNGYSFNANVVQLSPAIGDTGSDGLIVVALADPSEDESRPQTQNQYRQVFMVACLCAVSEQAADPNLERVRTHRRAEIEWCLTHEGQFGGDRPNQTRGGLAEDTTLAAIILPNIEPGQYSAFAELHFEVLYKVQINNPFASVYD